ncbi:MAG: Coenzyme F420 hydrogenase/dehydrogenase, beta subunit C-terminal domain [Thermoplasmata archaeon]|nr:MAG: Coenzyme F420 hydrogenase/dehydrogenase, beta subunit C-terminal domain [Thermoplasmata archaeon]
MGCTYPTIQWYQNGGLIFTDKASQEKAKTFKDLIQQVHEPGICGQCGGCVSFCFAGDLTAIEMGPEGKPHYKDEENCLKCGICFLICPQISILDEEIKEEYNWKLPIGNYQRITTAISTKKEVLENCSDGGVVTSILLALLERNLIDGAIVSQKTGPFGRKPIIATTYEEILSAAGSRFIGTSQVEELGNYTTYSPAMRELGNIRNLDLLRIAVVGTPCQIHTIRKMQNLGVTPAHVVKYTIGLFCMENFSFNRSEKEYIEHRLGFKMEDIKKINIREDFIVTLKSNDVIYIPLKEIDKLARPACFACTDYTNDFADISMGGIGSPEGYTTTIIRTEEGKMMYNEAKRNNYIQEISKSHKNYSLVSDRLDKLTYFAIKKRERGLFTLEKLKKGELEHLKQMKHDEEIVT